MTFMIKELFFDSFSYDSYVLLTEPGPNAAIVGGLLKGRRMAEATGRVISEQDQSRDAVKKYQFLSEILKWRAHSTPEQNLFTLLNSKVLDSSFLPSFNPPFISIPVISNLSSLSRPIC